MGNSFVSLSPPLPSLSLSLSPPKHPAALSSPRTRSSEARGRLAAGVFDAAIAAAVGVLFAAAAAAAAAACETTPARAYCLLLDLGGSIGRAQHTHTHTYTH